MNNIVKIINKVISVYKDKDHFKENKISDGYHTFEELYEFRKMYNAALFNEWAKSNKYNVHKSIKHYDGELCFDGSWFVVMAILPEGQITNHYKLKEWSLFNIPSFDIARYKFDGHTPNDVLIRLNRLNLTRSNNY